MCTSTVKKSAGSSSQGETGVGSCKHAKWDGSLVGSRHKCLMRML